MGGGLIVYGKEGCTKSGLTDLTHLFGKLQVRREGGGEAPGGGGGRQGSVLRRRLRPEPVGHRGWKAGFVWQGGAHEVGAP